MEQPLERWFKTSDLNIEIYGGDGPVRGSDSERRPNRKHSGAVRRMLGNRVLLLGRMRELALYRAEVLRDRGFEVKIPADTEEAIAEIARGAYDVAVLSYTLSSDEVQQLAELVRQSCADCPLVTISKSGRLDRVVNPDETVLADEGPSALIKVLRRLQRHH
jgi:CheY-like chemotaxis protein